MAQRRGLVSWIGLILMVFNILAGLALPGQQAQARDGRQIICTAAGMVSIPDGPETTAPPVSYTDLCQDCLPLMQGWTALPVPAVVPMPALAQDKAQLQPALALHLPPSRLPGSASPRAPPLSVQAS